MKGKISHIIVILLLSRFSLEAQSPKETLKMEPKIYIVLDITVTDSAMYEQYRSGVEPIINKYGGRYLVRSGGMSFDIDPDTKVIPIEGNWNPNRFIITEWDSMEEFQKFTNSTEYKNIVVLRAKSSTTKSIIVKEYMKK